MILIWTINKPINILEEINSITDKDISLTKSISCDFLDNVEEVSNFKVRKIMFGEMLENSNLFQLLIGSYQNEPFVISSIEKVEIDKYTNTYTFYSSLDSSIKHIIKIND